ncbi:MAG: hypothetical protein KA138_04615 [Saprospiraceae bacterium]|nr:hypothetical protein [Lewinellaceae bacterium]MBP6810774.1 hypothetical protein [Saprospiraceae bacterium]
MRQLTILLFTLVISFQAFYNVGVTVYWLANRTFIATNLCENRNDPKKHCEGKCYLNKKISETPDNAPANSERKSSNLKKGIELADIASQFPALTPPGISTEQPASIQGEQNLYRFTVEKSIFHPPPSFAGV